MRYEPGWFKSSYSSGASNNCVETRIAPANVDLRDSTHPHDTILTFDTSAWRTLLTAIQNDEL